VRRGHFGVLFIVNNVFFNAVILTKNNRQMQINSKKILYLTDRLFIAKGNFKEAYIHPDDNSLCVKVFYGSEHRIRSAFSREKRYMDILQKRNIPRHILPEYHGAITTSRGIALVYELIRDYDGHISQNIYDYAFSEDFLADNFSMIVRLINKFKQDVLLYELVPTVFGLDNILYRRLNAREGNLVIIDDLGSGRLVPLEFYFTFFAQAKIKRKWRDFMRKMKERHDTPLLRKLSEEITGLD
jgi:hypothetical protein